MTGTDQREALEQNLSGTLCRVLDFLRFAEAKNAALLTFSSALAIATVNLMASDRPFRYGFQTTLYISLSLFILTTLVALWSFLPRLQLRRFNRDPFRQKNLLYFGDIATLDIATFRGRARERYMPSDGSLVTQYFIDDLSEQILVNSRIVKRKFYLFNIGVGIIIIAFAISAVPLIGGALNVIIGHD